MVGESAGAGKEILERRPLNLFPLLAAAKTRIEIVLEISAKINLVEGVLFLGGNVGLDAACFDLLGGLPVTFFLAARNIVEQWHS